MEISLMKLSLTFGFWDQIFTGWRIGSVFCQVGGCAIQRQRLLRSLNLTATYLGFLQNTLKYK